MSDLQTNTEKADGVVDVLCEELSVKRSEISGKGHAQNIVMARSMMLLILANLTPLSSGYISKTYLGGRALGTIDKAREEAVNKYDTDKQFAGLYTWIITQLRIKGVLELNQAVTV